MTLQTVKACHTASEEPDGPQRVNLRSRCLFVEDSKSYSLGNEENGELRVEMKKTKGKLYTHHIVVCEEL